MDEVRKHLKRANVDQPRINPAELAKTIGVKNRRGVGDTKREEVRFLILSGLPHAEVMRRGAVSSGMVSAIRQEMGEAIPLYRNSESGLCVPFACRKAESSDSDDTQAVKRLVGPAGLEPAT